jgi:membrane fusion protein, multidrug efflux system
MLRIKLTFLVLIPLGAGLLLLIACSEKVTQSVAAAPAPPVSDTPTPASATTHSGDGGFTVSGPLIVEHQLDVLAQRDGVITKLLSQVGARVHTGDLLAQLDDRQLTADLEGARARTRSTEADLNNWEAEVKVLQSDYERAQKLWDAQVLTREQLEHAKFKLEADQWDVKRVQQLLINAKEAENSLGLELEKTRIRAPFSGVVARRYVREGQQVAKGDRLFWVSAEGPLRMRFTLPEKFFGRVRRGYELPLTIPDLPQQTYHATVAEVSPVVDPASGTFEVTVELVGSRGALRPGMTASVTLDRMP